ncbi:MAG: hypothetical protein JXR76_19775 [Deltaproteobacteria bacterium]|nr:hypothetical protein [Deltaproteobacteria bacterium]
METYLKAFRKHLLTGNGFRTFGMALMFVFTFVACELPGEGEDDTDTVLDSATDDTESVTDVGTDTAWATDSDTLVTWECRMYYSCVDSCHMGDSDIDTGYPSSATCEESCAFMYPGCMELPIDDCQQQFEMCIDDCLMNPTEYPEICMMKCEDQVVACQNSPGKCEDQLDLCMMSCDKPDCLLIGDDSGESYCLDSSDEFYGGCVDMCFYDYDMCMGFNPPPPPPPLNCEKEYEYCLDSCAWDDKFCHDHCYESFFYCKDSITDRCDDQYDYCTDSCAWDDKFCHDHCYESFYYCNEYDQGDYDCTTYCDEWGCFEECCRTECDGWGCWEECEGHDFPNPNPDPDCVLSCDTNSDGTQECFEECCWESCNEWGCDTDCSVGPVDPPYEESCAIRCTADENGSVECWEKCCITKGDSQGCWENPVDISDIEDTDVILVE